MNKPVSRVRRWTLIGLTLSLLLTILAACNKPNLDDPNNRRTLRIGTMYGSKADDSYFRQQFTDLYEFSHPGIDIQIVPAIDWSTQQFEEQPQDGKPQMQPDPMEKVKAIMTGANPVDVLIINDMSFLPSLVNENMLKQLDPLLKQDKIDLNEFVPSVIDGIRDQGNNNIYALTPTFQPAALYYNKKLFQKANVPLPHDNMTWDDVFNLAKQMTKGSGKDAVFGFSFNEWGGGESYWDIQNYAAPLELKMYDANAEKMTVNSPQWQNVWSTFYDLYKAHVTPRQEDMQNFQDPQAQQKNRFNPFQGRLFLNGHVAMTIGQYGLINDIQQMNDNSDKLKIDKLEWDVVSAPFHASVPNVGGNMSLNNLAGINAKAQNPDDAWEFVKFMNGKDWAKFKSRSTYEMPTRTEYVKPRDGLTFNIQAFTKLKPAPFPGNSPQEQKMMRERPNLSMVQEMANRQYMEVIQGKKSVKEALQEFETKGNDLLQKIKAQPTGEIKGVFDDVYPGGGKGMTSSGSAVAVPAG